MGPSPRSLKKLAAAAPWPAPGLVELGVRAFGVEPDVAERLPAAAAAGPALGMAGAGGLMDLVAPLQDGAILPAVALVGGGGLHRAAVVGVQRERAGHTALGPDGLLDHQRRRVGAFAVVDLPPARPPP